MAARETTRPIAFLLTHVASDLAYLAQTEFRMARAEMGEKASTVSNAGVSVALGGVIVLGGFIVLLFDIARWITAAGLAYRWSLLIVALVALAIGAALAMAGVSKLRGSGLAPNRTLEQVRQDYLVAKEHIR
jgi:NADH:ubiquinone oxidoreductase subunit 6 (subunit J)